ncbi:hypothetical protein [Alteromonas confluentis]|uniref:Uncharacterized protein n=1 Tax=Alteromonas confluentis TaxID=1656094 RepID=A0A1E7ZEA1_9ALTE|nr:hypothetical protein [Alteromonas confluentis]OFC71820.1 hypothetical protein BFC18_06605 [Alteromonas confluentis]
MTVTTYDFPDAVPTGTGLFVLRFNSQLDTNDYSGHEFVVDNAGERWMVRRHWPVLFAEERDELYKLLARLRGPVNKVRMKDPKFTAQKGTWAGSPVVDGGGQYGLYVDVRNFGPSQMVAAALDRFMIGGQLLEVRDDVTSNASGKARIYLNNELRNIPANGTTLISDVNGLSSTCRWTNPKQVEALAGNKRIYRDVTLDFMESFT